MHTQSELVLHALKHLKIESLNAMQEASILAWKDDQRFSKAAASFIDSIQEIHKMES